MDMANLSPINPENNFLTWTGKRGRGYGATWLSLIPKKVDTASFEVYRPISLSTFVSKINTKILASRLLKVLPKIISSQQIAFQKGKDIADHILLVEEVYHEINRKVEEGCPSTVCFATSASISDSLQHEKWSLRYFVIEFPAHSPLDLPGVVLHRSISRTKFAAAELAEGVYNALREKEGLISHYSLQDAQLYKKAGFYYPLGPDPFPFEGAPSPEKSKAPSAAESNPAMSSPGNQSQGNSTALAIRKPTAALEAIPISAIPGLRRPIPSQKRPREGVTDDDFLPKKNKGDDIYVSPSPLSASSDTQHTIPAATSGGLELPHPDIFDCEGEELRDQSALKRPVTQPQPEASGFSPHTTTIPQVMEEEGVRRQEPESSPTAEKEVEVQTETEIPSSKKNEVGEQRDTKALLEMEREIEKQPEPEGQCSTATLPAPNIPIQRKFTSQTYPAFTEGWAGFSRGLRSLQASHWTIQGNLEKMRESVQEPAIPQARPGLLALNALHFMEQQSLLTLTEEYLGGASGNYRAVVLLKEKALAAKALQQKVDSLEQQVRVLQEENARLKADGSMELTAERSKVKSLQEQIAAYQRETQDLEAQFDRLRAQISILESRASPSEYKVGNLEAGLVEKESRISERENSLQEAKHEGSRSNEFALFLFLPRILGGESPSSPPTGVRGAPPSPDVLLNGTRTEASSGRPGTSRPQKRCNPHSGASRLVSGARPSSQGSPSPQQTYGQPPEEWGDYDMGGNRLPFIRREKAGKQGSANTLLQIPEVLIRLAFSFFQW
ncbi:unnamed protein product [Cuscuta campestris]|uniref:Reverse transcriptase domain-containing protein n=1 Tax=Cuscuta campestris TaxID=132261 RepID=A0A484ML73_9ASTE|nr:unnamed protein product [Cuscuta campestris]